MKQLIDFFKDHPTLARLIFFGTIGGVVIWSLTTDTSHGHSWVEKHIPAFWSIFGFISCLVLIFFARWFSDSGIRKGDDYYGD
ncbi:MAG: hypothetical protein D6B25_03750 [Desulfobulbaceae bacterium]|nr:MAG: hypothetical protein D6B25_03750 [Desulfobulbaceae bacterium]